MPAYMIVTREGPIADQEAMDTYSAMNRANAATFVAHYGIRPLAVYGAQQLLEGEGADGAIILEFPDPAKARAWYDSPEYQAALPYRMKAAPYRVLLVEGL